MSALIQANYEQLQQVARRFQSQSESIQQVSQQIENRVTRLTSSWAGEGATAFVREMRSTVLPAVTRLRTALAEASRVTLKIGQTVNDAETEASRLFVSQPVGSTSGDTSNNGGNGGGSGNGNPATTSTLLYTGGAETILVQDGGGTEPTDEGQEYIDATQEVASAYPDVDPVLLGMIVRNEWNHRSWENALPFTVLQRDPDFSYGAGQIKGDTAMEIIRQHPELFEDYSQIYIDGELTKGRVEWELFVNKEFNLRVAATLIGQYGSQLDGGFAAAGIAITDTPQAGQLSITPLQHDQLIAIMYNEGPTNITNALASKSPQEIIDYINTKLTANQGQIDNVWENETHIEDQVGTGLGEWEPTPTPTATMQA